MPQVVRASGQRRSGQFRAERDLAGGVPDAAVGAFAEDAAAGSAEQPPVRCGPILAQVLPEQVGQSRRHGDDPDRSVRAVLEAARFVRRAGAGPRGAGARAGAGEDQLAPPVPRQDEAGAAECYGFLGAQRGVVQAAEERGQLRAEPSTSARIARTRARLATVCGLTGAAALGGVHRTWLTGLAGSRPSSTA